MRNVIRAKVSGSRVRYIQDGFDLDLTYITSRLIAMGYPASGMEKTYRNDINQVSRFLNTHHPNLYRVYNLSERKYDESKFENCVRRCGFPDHHPPPLDLLFDIINDMLTWITLSPKHVLVVHCLAGKGRTGVICSCFLLLMGTYGDVWNTTTEQERRQLVDRAIQDFWQVRGQGVRFPSQALYIYYFVCILRHFGTIPKQLPRLKPPKKLMLKQVVLHSIPDYDALPHGGCTPFLQVLPAHSEHKISTLWYNSAWENPSFDTWGANAYGSIVFETNCMIQGDVVVRCFHANASSMLGRPVVQMFHVSFHTNFIYKCDVYRIPKEEVDEAHDSDRYDASFCLDFHIEPWYEDDHEEETFVSKGELSLLDLEQTVRQVRPRPQLDRRRSTGSSNSSLIGGEKATPMMGWLYKQGGFIKSWKRRWFVARDGQLTYFKTASDPTPLGVVDLHRVHVDVAGRVEETTATNPMLYYFKLVPPKKDQRVWYFGADTEKEQIEWIRALAFHACFRDLSATELHSCRSSEAVSRRLTTPSFRSSECLPKSEPVMTSRQTVDTRGSLDLVGFHRPTTHRQPSACFYKENEYGEEHFAPVAIKSMNKSGWEQNHFLTSQSIPAYARTKPLCSTGPISEQERQTIIDETFQVGRHICTADELEEAGRLQRRMRKMAVGKSTLLESLTRAVKRNDYETAEQILVEMVLLHHPKLVDALECNPIAFADMISGSILPYRSTKEIR